MNEIKKLRTEKGRLQKKAAEFAGISLRSFINTNNRKTFSTEYNSAVI